jgi:hypothetical protein
VQATDNRDREPTLSVQNLGDPGARADDLFQIPSRQPLLLYAERLTYWVYPALNRTPARKNFCGSTASPSIRVS